MFLASAICDNTHLLGMLEFVWCQQWGSALQEPVQCLMQGRHWQAGQVFLIGQEALRGGAKGGHLIYPCLGHSCCSLRRSNSSLTRDWPHLL